ncbi:MAG TPA: ribose 5-phosphate isomerase B [Polyangia bacterium]|nr:ribose 5-phosphate isomerase B [Polyangia bacterium]
MKTTARKIFAGSDHAGFSLRHRLVEHLRAAGHSVEDLGTTSEASCDYPDYAAAVGRAVAREPGTVGLLVCGTGMGVCIAANKIHGVRAVDAWNVDAAKISRAHNDANVLCLGARTLTEGDALAIADAWLVAPFDGGERHTRRVDKIRAIEKAEIEVAEDRAAGQRQQKQ